MKPTIFALKTLFTIVLVFCNIHFLLSQKWYSGGDAGYMLGLASQNITSDVDIGSTQTSNTIVKGSFGKGLNVNAFLGYKLTNSISCEGALSYLTGSRFMGHYSKEAIFQQEVSISGDMFRITPALKIIPGEEGNKRRFYIKIGMVARLAGKITMKSTYLDMQNKSTSITETKYSKGFSFGAMAGAGITNRLNDRTTVFAEVYFISQSWAPKNGDVVKYSVNGIDQSDLLNPGQKHFHFSNSYTSATNNQSGYVPYTQLKQYYNFSSVGLKLGIQFILEKKK